MPSIYAASQQTHAYLSSASSTPQAPQTPTALSLEATLLLCPSATVECLKRGPPAARVIMAETAKDQGPTPVSTAAASSQEKPAVLIVGGLGASTESRPDRCPSPLGDGGC